MKKNMIKLVKNSLLLMLVLVCSSCLKVNLSTAAVIAPQDGAPTLGTPGDFSTTRRYVVTAANGTKKDWTIQVTALNK